MKYYFYSGIMISFAIAIIVNTVLKMENAVYKILGIFGASIFMALGLLIFPMRKPRVMKK